jgi:transmembrane sensor
MSMRSPARAWIRTSFRIATMLAVFAPLGFSARGSELPAEPLVYTTAIGEARRVVLGQHTVANLNTLTSLSVGFTPSACDIELQTGEALFEVRRSEAGEVHVTAGEVRVEADAAAFSVRLREKDGVEVLVRKGDVKLTGNREPVTLTANEQARVSSRGVSLQRLDESEVQRRLQWTTGYLSFSGETLEEVVDEFNRYNPQKLIVEDHAIRRLRIGGNFQSTDPEGFVAALRPMGVRRANAEPADSTGLIRLVGAQVR